MTEYNKNNPFHAKIKERHLLNKEGSTKNTYHIVIDIKGSNFTYKVGDSLAIIPNNISLEVEEILSLLKKNENEPIVDPRTQSTMNLKHYLLTKANISRITVPFMKMIFHHETNFRKKAKLDHLLEENNKEERSEFIASHDLLDLFRLHPLLNLPTQELLCYISPLLPRFYSIASSQLVTDDEIHLLVATFTYQQGQKIKSGLGSQFISLAAEINKTPIQTYVHPTPTFVLPEDSNAPIIMIGPGTGVAPYRGFLQERIAINAKGKNWLIFGERNRSCDFYYEDFFLALEKEKKLRLDLAFSRDQHEKIYVQHKLIENSGDIWKWIEEGAFIYVCGDAKQMAKDVNETLVQIIQKEGNLPKESAHLYIKQLRKQKRYLMDVY